MAEGRALVTGAAGSIGGAVVEELSSRGFEVDAWDLVPPAAGDGVHPAAVDLRDPIDPALLRPYRFVAHLASVTENRDDRSTLADHLGTVAMTAHLLDALADVAVESVVTTSSQLVYAPGEQHPDEDAPVSASTGFAAAKLSSEAFLEAFGRIRDVPTATLRLANIIGPATRRGVVSDFVRRAAEAARSGDPVEITGSTHHRRSFLSLADCASAIVHLGLGLPRGSARHQVFNVANLDSVSIADVAALVSSATGVAFHTEADATDLARQGDPGTVLPLTDRTTSAGWTPRTGSAQVVESTAAALWERQHADADR